MWQFFVALFLAVSIVEIKSNDSEASTITLAADPCPRGWTHVSQIDQCYIIPDVFLPWNDAQAYCQNVTGGNLVSIYSQFEYDTLLRQIRTNEYALLYPFWIGLEPDTYYPYKASKYKKFLPSSKFFKTPCFFGVLKNFELGKNFLYFDALYWQWPDAHYPNYTKWLNNSRPDSKVNPCVGWKTVNNDGWKSIDCKYAQPFICKQHAQNCPTLIINGTSGNVTSPNYPFEYDLNANCIYHINVPTGFVVQLDFRYIDIDLLAYLYIYDGPSVNSDMISEVVFDYYYWYYTRYTSTETAMTLQFETATWAYGSSTGWMANYKAVAAPPATYINGTSGALTSPNYPGNYTDRQTLYYKFVSPPNHRLIITIWDFVTEFPYDWLQIYDGEFVNDGTPLLDWDGDKTSQLPKIITTTTNAASLIWHTNTSKALRGYNMTWVAENYFG